MKRLTARQLRLVVLLNFVIIGLLVGLLWLLPTLKKSADPAGTPAEIYTRARVAEISLNPNLGWELELLGSGEEDVIFAHEISDSLYVFGNTSSSNQDFDQAGIYLAVVDIFGKLNEDSFFNYGDEGDVLRSVALCNSGFLLAVEGADFPYLLTVGINGAVIKKSAPFTNSFEAVDRLIPYHDGWLLLTRPLSKSVFGLRCVFFDFDYNFALSSLAQSAYSLSSVDVVLFSSGPVVFCNAENVFGVSYPAAVQFSVSASARVSVLESHAGKVAGLSVHNGEYLLLTAYQGSSFIKLNANFEPTLVQQLSLNMPLYFTDLDDGHYAAFYPNTTYIFDSNLTRILTIDGLKPHHRLYTQNATIFSGETALGVCVTSFVSGVSKSEAVIGVGSKPILALGAKSLYCIYVKNNNVIICTVRA